MPGLPFCEQLLIRPTFCHRFPRWMTAFASLEHFCYLGEILSCGDFFFPSSMTLFPPPLIITLGRLTIVLSLFLRTTELLNFYTPQSNTPCKTIVFFSFHPFSLFSSIRVECFLIYVFLPTVRDLLLPQAPLMFVSAVTWVFLVA